MPTEHPKLPPIAQPTREIFDPYNSSSTGHQRAESRGTTAGTLWRDHRTYKLQRQFRDRTGEGGERLSLSGFGRRGDPDSEYSGNGKRNWNGGTDRDLDIRSMMGCHVGKGGNANGKKRKAEEEIEKAQNSSAGASMTKRVRVGPIEHGQQGQQGHDDQDRNRSLDDRFRDQNGEKSKRTTEREEQRGIFSSLTVYINGSTYPLVSDHRLKQLLTQHGANISLGLSRRAVTHVILGIPNHSHSHSHSPSHPHPHPHSPLVNNNSSSSSSSNYHKIPGKGPSIHGTNHHHHHQPSYSPFPSSSFSGAGGGLSARKIQKEIGPVDGRSGSGSKGIKFVTADWVLESIKAGTKLSEARFAVMNLAEKGQGSIYGIFQGRRERGHR